MKQTLHIIVLTAFLGGIIAPACGFAWGGKYSVIEICTAQGLESRIVDNDSNSDNNPAQKMADQCQFCFSQAHLSAFLVNERVLEQAYFAAEKIRFNLYKTIYLSRRHSDHAARAPPAFV